MYIDSDDEYSGEITPPLVEQLVENLVNYLTTLYPIVHDQDKPELPSIDQLQILISTAIYDWIDLLRCGIRMYLGYHRSIAKYFDRIYARAYGNTIAYHPCISNHDLKHHFGCQNKAAEYGNVLLDRLIVEINEEMTMHPRYFDAQDEVVDMHKVLDLMANFGSYKPIANDGTTSYDCGECGSYFCPSRPEQHEKMCIESIKVGALCSLILQWKMKENPTTLLRQLHNRASSSLHLLVFDCPSFEQYIQFNPLSFFPTSTVEKKHPELFAVATVPTITSEILAKKTETKKQSKRKSRAYYDDDVEEDETEEIKTGIDNSKANPITIISRDIKIKPINFWQYTFTFIFALTEYSLLFNEGQKIIAEFDTENPIIIPRVKKLRRVVKSFLSQGFPNDAISNFLSIYINRLGIQNYAIRCIAEVSSRCIDIIHTTTFLFFPRRS